MANGTTHTQHRAQTFSAGIPRAMLSVRATPCKSPMVQIRTPQPILGSLTPLPAGALRLPAGKNSDQPRYKNASLQRFK